MITVWHFIVHIIGADYGLPYGIWNWYDFWSGVAGSFLVGAIVFVVTMWAHQTCHYSWRCLRRGKHEAAGGVFKLCWKHHPDMGQRPHHDMIHRLHGDWKRGRWEQPA